MVNNNNKLCVDLVSNFARSAASPRQHVIRRASSANRCINELLSGASLAPLALVTALGGGFLYAPNVVAQIILSEPQTTTRTVTQTPLVVSTDDSFSVQTTSGSGLVLTGTNGTRFEDANAASITGFTNGLSVINNGTGALEMTSGGTIVGTTLRGIDARQNSTTGTGLSLLVNDVRGGTDGIFVNNNATGAASVTATGIVVGTTGRGIDARQNSATGTGISLVTNEVRGGTDGILITNIGSGAVIIDSTGLVVGTASRGIDARQNSSTGTSVSVSVNSVEGSSDGIVIVSQGTGTLTVTATGTVTGSTNRGIYARNLNASNSGVTVSTSAVSGRVNGINVRNAGIGITTVTASGAVESEIFSGIDVRNTSDLGNDIIISAAGVTGGSNGIFAVNYGVGDVVVTASGAVTGTATSGISVSNRSSGNSITVSSAAVNGASNGILANNYGTGALTVTATGNVIGSGARGIDARNGAGSDNLIISAANVSGGSTGIFANNSGTGVLSVTTLGDVIGETGAGINAINSNSDSSHLNINAASVSGDSDGINATNSGSGDLVISTTGVVQGIGGNGIYAKNSINGSNLRVSTGNVIGDSTGILAKNYGIGDLSVMSTGTVVGTNGTAIRAFNEHGRDLNISVDDASSVVWGIYGLNRGTGALTIMSTGAAIGLDSAGILGYGHGTDLNISANNVSGGTSGLLAINRGSGALSVTITGLVDGIYDGIYANNVSGTDLTVSVVGSSGGFDGIDARNEGAGALLVSTSGFVSGASGSGIDAHNSSAGTDLIVVAKNVSGGTHGISANNFGSGALSVSVSGAVTGGSGVGIKTESNAGGAVSINLVSTSSVEAISGAAIVDGAGDAVITLHQGARINGSISLGDGNDTISVMNGATSSGITALSGGSGAFVDTLNLNAGLSGALSDWEAINANTSNGNFAVSAIISGNAALAKLGSGALTLTGANSFSGGTTVAAGSLIGSAQAFGSGAIVNNGTLVFNQITNGSFGSVISGAGTLTKTGTGALALTGANDFAGGATVSSGTLIGNTQSFGRGGIVNNATLVFDQAADASFSSVISGSGSLVKLGAGALTLTGANSFSGGTTISSGIIIGNNQSFGSGALINNAMLVFDQATDGSVGSAISGSGSLTKVGVGALSLTGSNSYKGGTTISSGTLIGNAQTFGSGGIVNNAALVFDQKADGSFGAIISGSGSLIKTGSGSLTFVGVNPYTGGTTISSGTLIGSNQAFGTGAIVNNAVLAFDQSTDGQFGASISGSGAVIKSGGGALTLNGTNSFTGGTTIAAGTLIGNNQAFGSGAIVNNAALVVDQAADGSFGLTISGSGSLTKLGIGALTLTHHSPMTGSTFVAAGRLNVRGSLISSAVTVQSGASLGGNGMVGTLTAQAGSTVSPGNSIGTLSVNGDLTLAAGSTLAMEVAPTGADMINVTGIATISGNLAITAAAGQYSFFQRFTLLSAGAVTGTFVDSSLGDYGATFKPILIYDGTSVVLQLDPASLVQSSGGTLGGNGLAVAGSFDGAFQSGQSPKSFFNLYALGSGLSAALGQFSGELHSAVRRVGLQSTGVLREAAFDALNAELGAINDATSVTKEISGTSNTVWIRSAGSWGKAEADNVGSGHKIDQTGILTGVDIARNGLKLGGLFSQTSTDVNMSSAGQSKVNSTGATLYAGYRQDDSGFALGFGAGVTGSISRSSRAITVPTFAQTLVSKTKNTSYQYFADVSYDIARSANTRMEPFARIAHVALDNKAFAENGGNAALQGNKQSNRLTTASLGLRGVHVGKTTVFSGSAAWQRTSGDRAAPTFVALSGIDTPYEVRSVALDRNAVAIETQAKFSLSSKFILGVGYSAVVGSNNSNHSARATVRYAF